MTSAACQHGGYGVNSCFDISSAVTEHIIHRFDVIDLAFLRASGQ